MSDSRTPDLKLVDPQGWDKYWDNKHSGGIVYGLIASFYRKCIIRPTLNHFIEKYFAKGTALLHAGCGSGEVDVDLRNNFSLTGLDISANAVKLYKRNLGHNVQAVRGSIFSMPFEPNSIQGIYNLGVMEHFTEEEIGKILSEFHRVLAPTGKIVLFWPPEFGLSVRFLRFVKGTIKLLFNKDVQFHPDEISLLKSRLYVERILAAANLRVIEYAFGPRDLWTYSVVVAGK